MGRVTKHLMAALLYAQVFKVEHDEVSQIDAETLYHKLNEAGYCWRASTQKWGIAKKRKATRQTIANMGFILCRVICLTKDAPKVTEDTIVAWELIGYTLKVSPTSKVARDNKNTTIIYFQFIGTSNAR